MKMTATYVSDSDSKAVPFLAICPKCKFRQPQHRYNRAALLRLLNHDDPIEAYCPECDEFWPISVHERARLAAGLGKWQEWPA
jgi:hypothetical protein